MLMFLAWFCCIGRWWLYVSTHFHPTPALSYLLLALARTPTWIRHSQMHELHENTGSESVTPAARPNTVNVSKEATEYLFPLCKCSFFCTCSLCTLLSIFAEWVGHDRIFTLLKLNQTFVYWIFTQWHQDVVWKNTADATYVGWGFYTYCDYHTDK